MHGDLASSCKGYGYHEVYCLQLYLQQRTLIGGCGSEVRTFQEKGGNDAACLDASRGCWSRFNSFSATPNVGRRRYM
jgi:hypothetical protein